MLITNLAYQAEHDMNLYPNSLEIPDFLKSQADYKSCSTVNQASYAGGGGGAITSLEPFDCISETIPAASISSIILAARL